MAELKTQVFLYPRAWRLFAGSVVLFLGLFGGFLRFTHLFASPYWMDEGYTINATLSLLEHGGQELDSGKIYACPMYCYPTAAIVRVLGADAGSYRFLAALAGVATIFLIYIVGSQLFTNAVGLLAAACITFSYWQIAWSRQARWYTLFELFTWAAIFCFYKMLYGRHSTKNHRAAWALACAGMTVLAALTHGLGLLLPVAFLAWILLEQVFVKRNFKLALACGLAVLVAVAVVALKYSVTLHYVLPYYLNFYLRSYWLFIALGAIAFLNKEKTREKLLLLFLFVTYLLPLSFLTDVVEYRYLFHLTPAIYLLGAVGTVELALLFKRALYRWAVGIAVCVLFFACGMGVFLPPTMYLLESDDPATISGRPYYAYTPQPDWNAAYGFIQTHKQPDDVVVSSMPQFNKIFLQEPGYWLAYDYLGGAHANQFIFGDQEYYVGAQALQNLDDVQNMLATKHGFIVFDYMATDGRVPEETLSYIRSHTTQVFYKNTNAYSQVWVYRF